MKCLRCNSNLSEIDDGTFECDECSALYRADLRHYGKKELIHDIDMRLHKMSLDVLYLMKENQDLERLNDRIIDLKEFIADEYKTEPND